MSEKRLVAVGVKKKGEKEFKVKTEEKPSIIHNGKVKRCSICGSVIPDNQCHCLNCGSSET